MTTSRTGMTRLAALYGMVEQMRSAERRVAAGAVEETACATAIAEMVRNGNIEAGRTALATGDRAEWTIAETTRDVVENRLQRLAEVRAVREAALAAAVTAHDESRVRTGQMERLMSRARRAEAIDEGRREQSVADDRYGSRQAWRKTIQARSAE